MHIETEHTQTSERQREKMHFTHGARGSFNDTKFSLETMEARIFLNAERKIKVFSEKEKPRIFVTS